MNLISTFKKSNVKKKKISILYTSNINNYNNRIFKWKAKEDSMKEVFQLL